MKLLLDFLPVALFFVVYKMTNDIILATAILVPASFAQIAYTRWSTGKIEKMQLITLVLVVVFGGLTVLLQDGAFIKWKPTVVNWLFAVVFLGSQLVGSKPVVQRIMGKNMQMPPLAWRNLNFAWVVFFVVMGGLNLFVAYSFSEDTWVNFKLFGMLGLTIVFILAQGVYIAKYVSDGDTNIS